MQISNCSRNMKPQWSPLLLINSLQRSGDGFAQVLAALTGSKVRS